MTTHDRTKGAQTGDEPAGAGTLNHVSDEGAGERFEVQARQHPSNEGRQRFDWAVEWRVKLSNVLTLFPINPINPINLEKKQQT